MHAPQANLRRRWTESLLGRTRARLARVDEALFFGLKAAVLAIVLEAVFRIGKCSLKNRGMVGLAVLAFIGIFFLDVPFPIIVFGAGLISFIGGRARMTVFQVGGSHGRAAKRAG
jgi:chromate transporter